MSDVELVRADTVTVLLVLRTRHCELPEGRISRKRTTSLPRERHRTARRQVHEVSVKAVIHWCNGLV